MVPKTELERHQRRAYHRDLLPSVLGYAVVLALSLSLVGDDIDAVGEWILMVLPAVPALWGVRAVVRHLRRVDEFQRLVQLEAMTAGFGVAMAVSVTLGFVGLAGVATAAAGWIVCSTGLLTWALAVQVRTRS